MQVEKCTTRDGKPGYKCTGGYCYPYTPGDKESRTLAQQMAHFQRSSRESHRKMKE